VGKYTLGTYYHNSVTILQRYSDLQAIGPSFSWSNTTGLLGDPNDAQLTFDWGLNAAVLFGRQKVKLDYSTSSKLFLGTNLNRHIYSSGKAIHRTESHRVTVPNLGGFAALSYSFTNAKVSVGYRADFFFGAMDRGLDTHHSVTTGYHGPYATISIGLGG
jgi:hypothetical protein